MLPASRALVMVVAALSAACLVPVVLLIALLAFDLGRHHHAYLDLLGYALDAVAIVSIPCSLLGFAMAIKSGGIASAVLAFFSGCAAFAGLFCIVFVVTNGW